MVEQRAKPAPDILKLDDFGVSLGGPIIKTSCSSLERGRSRFSQ